MDLKLLGLVARLLRKRAKKVLRDCWASSDTRGYLLLDLAEICDQIAVEEIGRSQREAKGGD